MICRIACRRIFAVCALLSVEFATAHADPPAPLLTESFEVAGARPGQPAGWHYLRHGRIQADAAAPDGRHCLSFTSDSPGRDAEVRRTLLVDGRVARGLDISLWVRCQDIRPGQFLEQRPQLLIDFYDADRRHLGQDRLGPWFGTFDWREERQSLPVPSAARSALVRLGLFGAVGEVAFDKLEVLPLDSNPTIFPAQ